MTRLAPTAGADQWTGPVLVRGWLRARTPMLHPVDCAKLIRKWLRLKADVNRGKGFLSFEYWQRFEQLVFGMHVGWASNEKLISFYRTPSHKDISTFAMRSDLVRAMKLETLAIDGAGHVMRVSGFVICADDSDLPNDALFPSPR